MTDPAARDHAILAGRRIGITADRRWREQAGLFERRGAEVMHGPTMCTLDLRHDERLRAVTDAVIAAPPEIVVATTGQGMKWWLEAAGSWGLDAPLFDALGRTEIIARGAKAASAVRAAGLEVAWRAPDETMAEIAAYLAARAGRPASMAIQIYDPDDEGGAVAEVAALADEVHVVPLYRWDLPADLGPAVALIEAIVARAVDAVTFTSQPAVRNLFRIADGRGVAGEVRAALAADVVAVCVGPVCAEAGRECGLTAMRWPELTRLPAMVRLTADVLGGAA